MVTRWYISCEYTSCPWDFEGYDEEDIEAEYLGHLIDEHKHTRISG